MLTNPSLIIQKTRSDGASYHLRDKHSEESSIQDQHPQFMKQTGSQNTSTYINNTNKLSSPSHMNADGELTRIMYETDNNGFFNMS